MQPTIVVTSPAAGMIYINGRFAGEADASQPLYAPVSPRGAVYLEYRPLETGWDALARKCVFSGGAPLPASLEGAEDLCCVAWPGGVLEVEIAPCARQTEAFMLDGTPCVLSRGRDTWLDFGGLRVELPEGAQRPRLENRCACPALLGETDGGGQYLATLTADRSAQTGLIVAAHIELSGRDAVNAVTSAEDLVGHGSLEQWIIEPTALTRVSAEPVWRYGAPRWPQTAEHTARAAVEAALAGQAAEANGYFSPALAHEHPLSAIGEICDLCVPMKFAPPDAHPCVGLLRMVNAHLAQVRPLYYRAAPSGGAQGPWQLEWIGLE